MKIKFGLLLMFLLYSTSAEAFITLVNIATPQDFTGNASFTIPSTTAGNLLVVQVAFRSNTTDTVTSITDGGDTFVSANARSTDSDSNRGYEIWYTPSVSGSKTSITVNQTGSGTISIDTFEYQGWGTFSLDTVSKATNATTSASTATCASMTTTGNGVIIGGFNSYPISAYSPASPFNIPASDFDTNPYVEDRNAAAGTYQASLTVSYGSGGYNCSLAAFKNNANIDLINMATAQDLNGGSAAYTIPSTTAGNLLVVLVAFRTSSSDTVTSLTDAVGDIFVSANARSVDTDGGRAFEIWYTSKVSNAMTSITVNQSGSGTISVAAFEFYANGGAALDTLSKTTNASNGASPATCGAITTTTANEVIIGGINSSIFDGTAVALPFAIPSQDLHQNLYLDAQIRTPGTYQASVTTDSTGAYSCSLAAFKSLATDAVYFQGD